MGTVPTSTLLSAVLLAACVGLSSQDEQHYSYEGDGPHHWSGSCQDGKMQSPINLGVSGTTDGDFEALTFINYYNNFNGTITNNGHTIQIQIVDHPHHILLTGGGLNKVYTLAQIHFHWKSEHTINNQRFPLEAHFVHFDQKLKGVSDAVKIKGGVAVLAVMFHELDHQDFDIPVLNEAKELKYNAKRNIIVSPSKLLPNDITKFYRYYGSLTTPGCDESVVWTVLAQSRPLSKTQISYFQKTVDKAGKILKNNYRPLQEQNYRIIYYQSAPPKQVQWVNSSIMAEYSIVLMTTLLIILKYLY